MNIRRSIIALGIALTATLAFATSATAAPSDAACDEARGCCSHHKGVCGCQDKSVVCCDNTLSPTCTC